MIGIVNYGLGNIQAILNIYKNLNILAFPISNVQEFDKVNRIILPGVGAFDWAMEKLNRSGLRDKLDELVIKKKIPVLGICVGMQMMAERSEEGLMDGLSWVQGDVKHFRHNIKLDNKIMDVPHMGWNEINIINKHSLLRGFDKKSYFYFLHSYYFSGKNKKQILTSTDYHGKFTSSFQNNNIYGVQFHPEKSHKWGIRLLHNFALI